MWFAATESTQDRFVGVQRMYEVVGVLEISLGGSK